MKPIQKSINELLDAGVIDQSAAERINAYYLHQAQKQPVSLLLIFGMIGSLLVGLGLILIVAHNWDWLSTFWQSACALLPVLLGQGLVIYAVRKNPVGSTWREGSSAFLLLAIGACVAMVSQIYQLPGELEDFLWIWILLGLPLVYLVPSLSIFYLELIGITWYGILTGYNHDEVSHFWWLILLWIPAYIWGLRHLSQVPWFQWAHLLLPVAVTIMLGDHTFPHSAGTWLIYLFWPGLLLHIASMEYADERIWFRRAYHWMGSAILLVLLYIFSFKPFWEQWPKWHGQYLPPVSSVSFWIMVGMGLLYLAWFFRRHGLRSNLTQLVWKSMPGFVSILLILNVAPGWGVGITNALILGFGIVAIQQGWRNRRQDVVNLGLGIILILICCRFFDMNWSFILRGLLFTGMGIAFFAANYFLVKNRNDVN